MRGSALLYSLAVIPPTGGANKGACGLLEDTDPEGFAAHVFPRGKPPTRMAYRNTHNKEELCARGPTFHIYHGNGHL